MRLRRFQIPDAAFAARGWRRGPPPYGDITPTSLVLASAQATGLLPPSDAALNAPVLQQGSSGSAVTTLQSDLGMIGSNYAVTVDGSFGPATLQAVTQFQTDQGLLAAGTGLTPGVVEANTWTAIQNASSFTTLPQGNAPVPGTGQWLAGVVQAAPAPVVKAAQLLTPAGAPSWVLPVAVAAFSVGGLAVVGSLVWWAVKPRRAA
ncbi:MAG: peptidoglycan-binding domain-containing protein [Terriglobales bacterium]